MVETLDEYPQSAIKITLQSHTLERLNMACTLYEAEYIQQILEIYL